MSNDVVIRKAGIMEIDTIMKLAETVWPVTYKDILSAEQISYMMNLFYSEASLREQFSKHTFLIVYLAGEPVGFASYSVTGESVYKLHKLYILTSIQGRGLGRALINFIITALQLSGGTALELNVNRNNEAKMFYERLGFEVFREEDIDIGNGYWMNDYVMRLSVF